MIRPAAAGLFFITGVFCMWLLSRSPVRNPWLILALFGLAILFGIVAGVLIGRVIRDRIVTGKRTVLPLFTLAILNLGVFTFLGNPLPTRNVSTGTLLVSAHLLVLAVLLIALDAYLLGFPLVPGRKGPSRARSLRWMVPLYASILAGVIVGFESGVWQRGTVPLEPLNLPQPLRRVTLEELSRESEAWFPPEITVNVGNPKSVVFEAPEREPVEIVPGGRIFEASGAVATVGDREVKMLGYVIQPRRFMDMQEIPGRPGALRFEAHETGPATFWSADGTPVDDLPYSYSGAGSWGTLDYQCKFCLAVPEGWRISSVYPPTFHRFPWDTRPGEYSGLHKGILWTQHTLRLPVPSPGDLRLGFCDGDGEVSTMPAREGETLALARNRILLVRMLHWGGGPFTSAGEGEKLSLRWPERPDAARAPEAGPSTAAIFYCVAPSALRVEAVLESGSAMVPDKTASSGEWLACRYPTEANRIREFRILEEPEAFGVVFHLPELKGFPPGNQGVMDRLDIFYPRVVLTSNPFLSRREPLLERVDSFLRGALGIRFVPEVDPTRSAGTDSEVSSIQYENVTIGELLDLYYPGRWWVKHGVVHTTGGRFGPIVWKVRQAVSQLRNGL